IREEATPRSSVPRTLSRVAPHLRPGSWRCTYSAEPHWQVTVMTYLDPRLRSAVEGIVALVRPEAVLLFGSRARDDSDDASDWDLFVVLPDDAPPGIARPSALRRAAAPAKLPIHAVAC